MSAETPSDNPIVQKLQVLFSGSGYNFYDQKNLARADDLMVRQRASASLGLAVKALTKLETTFRHRYIPPATREHPYPPAEIMERLRALKRLGTEISGMEGDIRGMAVPTQDKTWWRTRQEMPLLNQLLLFDYELLQQTAEISRLADTLTAEMWQEQDQNETLTPALTQLSNLIRDRGQLLQQP